MRRVRIALLGCGHVGSGLVRLLARSRARLAASHGVTFELASVLVRDGERRREGVDPALITTRVEDALSAVGDVVVELLGGIERFGSYRLCYIRGPEGIIVELAEQDG